MQLTYIRWADAQGDHGQQTPQSLEAMGTLTVETVGFLVSEDDDVVRLTGDILHFDMVLYRDTNVIPKAYIEERHDLDLVIEEWQ